MKRFTLIMALLLIVAIPTFAERVTSETAQKVATTFLNNNGAKTTQLTDLSKEAGFPNLYIFTAKQGFVVMSADDCVQPILGYSLAGEFLAENMPSNVRSWLQGYNDEIQSAIENQMKATAETVQLWKDLVEGNSKAATATTVVAPLIQTKWNQNRYYNNLCPAMSGCPGGHAYTGCTATTMAQIMKYYNYPSRGIGSHSYAWNGQTLSADFGSTTYDWNNMAPYYEYYVDDNGSYHWLSDPSSVEIDAVATLMYHCGVSVNMNYTPTGSGASISDAAIALKSYFNYSSTTEYKKKSNYTDTEWKTMVKNDLDQGRPLEYAGYDPNGTGGHAFVCDGYNSADYFHFNWGWAGAYDGYFSLANLDTGANNQSGSGNGVYTRDQEAIFGIQPVQCAASDPTNLTYTMNGLQNITLNWTAANGAASYNIYRNNNYVGNSTTNSYNEDAPFGTNVYYVRSVDANGNLSLSSNYVTVYIGYQTPIVDDLQATLSGNNVSLTWTAPEWCYPETETALLNYGNGTPYYSWSNTYYGHRHLATEIAQYAGKAVYKVSTFIQYPGTYSVYVYTNSNQSNKPDPNSLAFSKTGMQVMISNDWYEIDMDEPIILTGTNDLWVVMKQEGTGQQHPVPSFNLSEFNGNACYYGNSSPVALYNNISNSISWFINIYLTDGTYTYNLYQDGTRIAQGLNQTSYNATLNNNASNLFVVKTNYYGGETNNSNRVGLAKGNASLVTLSLADNDQMTVLENSTLTVSGALSNGNADHLILENGAQLVNNSTGVNATVKKNITAYTEGQNDGWHLIASPITQDIIPSADNGLLVNDFDLYKFDQSGDGEGNEWLNYESDSHPFTTIENKTGYLYANSGNPTLSFAGALVANATATTLTYDANATQKGFNLIGNPYPCNAYVTRSFYVLHETDNGSEFTLGSGAIPPCSAILVQAQGAGESVSFSKTAPRIEPNIAISVTQANTRDNAFIDKAKISFNENDQLSKYSLNEQHSKIYIPQNGQDFAVACANGLPEMPVNFKATRNGTYTLKVEIESLELDYLHLIDNLTGNDVDLLVTPSYTFEANTTDYASRFRLMFSPIEVEENGTSFAYYADGEIIINANEANNAAAHLQIVDMTGRVIVEKNATNRVSASELPLGVYVIRLIDGYQTLTQKLVIH